MSMRLFALPLWAAALLASLANAQAAEVYRWTDAQGRTHYGTQPPAGVAALPVRAAAPLAASAAEQAQADRERLLERAQRQAQDRDKAQARQDEQAQRSEQDRRERCATARDRLRLYDAGVPVYTRDRQGERVYLSDAQRDATTARLRAEVAANCSPGGTGGVAQDQATQETMQRSDQRRRCTRAQEALRDLQAAGSRIPEADLQRAQQQARAACGG